jgi:hypothetical protein
MYITSRNTSGDTLVACGDCGYAISMNMICKTPLQSAADMLSHMAAHKASRVLAPVPPITPKLEAVRGFDGKGMMAEWNMPSKSNCELTLHTR